MISPCLRQCASWTTCGLVLFLLLFSGCAREQQEQAIQINQEPTQGTESGDLPTKKAKRSRVQPQKDEALDTSSQPEPVAAGRSTPECYQLQPAASQKKKKNGGRCEPQSLPFARCRSGIISSCRLGWNNGPLTWFACEKQHKNTSLIPRANSVLILAANKGHNMPTGHVAYVEKVIVKDAANYRLIFSHTNYDRRCSLETNIEADYNSSTKTLNILSGAWKAWGKGLPVAGFILK